MFQRCNMLKKEFTSAVTIMPPIRHDNQPFRHFVKPKGTPLCPDGCLETASIFFFYAAGCFTNICKIGPM